MTREEALAILSEVWPSGGGGISWDDLIPVAEEIKRLRQTMQWQPIETAPRDRAILGYGIWEHEVASGDGSPRIDIIEGGPTSYGPPDGGEWWECITGGTYQCWLKPTHWMPLPDPPEV